MRLKSVYKAVICICILLSLCCAFSSVCFGAAANVQNHNMESPETSSQQPQAISNQEMQPYSVPLLITVGVILASVFALVIGLGLAYKSR